jgi:hypothetical protein
MNKAFGIALIASSLLGGAAMADELVSEKRAVDARVVKIKLGGVIDLSVKQGATASLVVYGEKRDLDKVTTVQDGDTIRIDMESNFSWGNRKQVRAELVLPAVKNLASTGVGKTEMLGFSGNDLSLSVDGAGAVTITSQYKNIDARMGGVGSMTLNAGETDSIALNLKGAGGVQVNGHSKLLRAKMGGVGSLNAKQLMAEAVDLDMSGIGSASVYAKNSATVNLSGLGSATIYGKPASRNANAQGLGSVRWD